MLISFHIPAHNEERALPRTLRAIHEAASTLGLEYEIIVADDASTDATARVAAEHGARAVTIDRRQIAAARNAAVGVSRGEILFFVDADTTVNAPVIRAALAELGRGRVGGGASVRFDEPTPLYARIMLPPINALFRWFGLSGGCFMYCRRSAFDAMGGWDESVYASEEISFARSLKRHGRFVTLRETVTTSGRKLRTHSPRELLSAMWPVMRQGVGALRSREKLGLWYGERRRDPADGNAVE